ncbi:hypothetical protein FOMG_02464 [Fusarium oxysporum f. sp. melonis 26406]|uniref:Phosphotransferase n=1 Tax=Fusarium oxysporum f. sp. melonis 26406 TaxID=1089452 RepID=X0ASI7_FUSOX|nr:hypothetical protein FOMG_02464 [Fusarium oxysporum f. sp. melonis 26406]
MALTQEAKRISALFELSVHDLNRGVQEFLNQMNSGLKKDETSSSQIPSYVTRDSDGAEKDLYLAAYLGGADYRVCSVNMYGDMTFKLAFTKVTISMGLMLAKTAEELCAFLATQIEDSLELHHPEHYTTIVRKRQTPNDPSIFEDKVFQLGFTFSFLGFDIPDSVERDLCVLLQQEIDKRVLLVRVAALVNDTVSRLMARSYTASGKTRKLLGVTFDTGTNGAHIEKLANIQKPIQGKYDRSTGEMSTTNPGTHMYEKHVSGMLLDELVRLAVLHMMQSPDVLLFGGLDTIANNRTSNTAISGKSPIQTQLEDVLDSHALSVDDTRTFKEIANSVVHRAARLSSISLAAIPIHRGALNHGTNDEPVDIGVDSSVIEHYPFYLDMVYEGLRAILGI